MKYRGRIITREAGSWVITEIDDQGWSRESDPFCSLTAAKAAVDRRIEDLEREAQHKKKVAELAEDLEEEAKQHKEMDAWSQELRRAGQ